jgi:glycerate dehydrogenase
MRIIVLDGYTLNPGDLSWDELSKLGSLTVYDRTPADKVLERIGDAELVFTNKTPLSGETIGALEKVRFIGVLATGYNIVDVEAAKRKGIVVCNVPSYSTSSVAQLTFALLLEICHHVGEHDAAVKSGAWTESPDFCFWRHPLVELADKTLGIVGFGRIGQAVSRIALAMGMRVIYHSRKRSAGLETGMLYSAGLDELLSRSDVISLHCPLFEDTRGMINKNTIAKMKDGVIILNTARGPLIVEEDLAEALGSGKVRAAAMDVVSSEPIKKDNPLLTAKNCIITPHIAWAPKEARIRLMSITVENARKFLQGTPVNVVNP